LFERGLIRPRINREKQIALFYVSAILKIAGDNLAAHLRLDLDGLIRSASANFIEIKGHVLCDNFRDKYWSHWRLGRFGLTGSVLKNPIQNKRREQDEEQIGPPGNSLV
jgi:hypothetical protein